MSNLNPAIIKSCNAHKKQLYLVTFEDGTRAAVFAYSTLKAGLSAAAAAEQPNANVIDVRVVWPIDNRATAERLHNDVTAWERDRTRS